MGRTAAGVRGMKFREGDELVACAASKTTRTADRHRRGLRQAKRARPVPDQGSRWSWCSRHSSQREEGQGRCGIHGRRGRGNHSHWRRWHGDSHRGRRHLDARARCLWCACMNVTEGTRVAAVARVLDDEDTQEDGSTQIPERFATLTEERQLSCASAYQQVDGRLVRGQLPPLVLNACNPDRGQAMSGFLGVGRLPCSPLLLGVARVGDGNRRCASDAPRRRRCACGAAAGRRE